MSNKQDYYPPNPPSYDSQFASKPAPNRAQANRPRQRPPQGPPPNHYQQPPPPGQYPNYGYSNYGQPPPGQYYTTQQPQPIYVQQPVQRPDQETTCLFWFCGLLQLATCIELLVLLI
ncbi:hypothetical protein DASB73_016010 [Starmerella bacillaris]|uniref:Uncharacterized protein n=1 Tax=Starmerella bacillaris TaxID=1247836 RepID=A0AAV5RGS5_STABA|nr:hypothetical protein DASB73_016010 [Starmerella bacillaris]